MRSRVQLLVLIAAGAAVLICGAGALCAKLKLPFCYRRPDEVALREFAAVARALQGRAFDIARVEGESLVLFTAVERGSLIEFVPKERLPLEPIIGRRELHQHVFVLERLGSNLRFTLAGSVADYWGVLHAPGGEVELQEIAHLSKIADHPEWYEFSTQP